MGEAKSFLETHSTAAFLFAAIAAEFGLKSLLFKPVVYGLVHAESAASLVTKLALANRDEGFTKMLLKLLAAQGGIDILNSSRSGSAKSIWEEFLLVRSKRNRVVHQAETASRQEAEIAISVDSCVSKTDEKYLLRSGANDYSNPIWRLPKVNETLDDIDEPLTRDKLVPVSDLYSVFKDVEQEILAHQTVDTFNEIFKVVFAKLMTKG